MNEIPPQKAVWTSTFGIRQEAVRELSNRDLYVLKNWIAGEEQRRKYESK